MRWWILSLGGLLACSSPETPATPTPDAGFADAGGFAEPAPPAGPDLTPCPAGWQTTRDREITVCEPWPASGRVACVGATTHYTGGAGCEPVGAVCPPGAWADNLGAPVLYVDDDATPGGDGSMRRPFDTLGAALAAAGRGTTIALARGRYTETVTVTATVTIAGACAAETVIAATIPADDPLIRIEVSRAMLTNVTVTGPRGGVLVGAGATGVRLEGVLIENVEGYGFRAEMLAEAQLRDVAIRDVLPRTSDGKFGRGLELVGGSRIEGSVSRSKGRGRLVWWPWRRRS